MKHGGTLLQKESFLDDLGLFLGDLKLPAKLSMVLSGLSTWRFSGNAETVMAPLRLADDTSQDVGELVHGLAGDVLVTGIHGGLAINPLVQTKR
jgi:hypothetical protein